ncbi:uncharacterized protein RSE6_11012 [Rhynchosporium secalis]|uniref:DASH complex subunit SPC34 n=1 Tax=Rhynchosporium secalis TaxID=38038 RepID=A0A1E1MLX9_RHYSE|nr:uncharacterized protein RSE6_11012 [Rhynchosporium secalis]
MVSLLESHLEQISLSAESIATLPFPTPKIFTNALLATPDITSLIRDTEPHERALFSVPSPPPHNTASTPYPDPAPSSRRQTVFNVAAGEITAGTTTGSRAPRRNTAVAAVLGAELHSEVRKTEGKGEIDIEVLLRGAEKLNAVYSVDGVPERITGLRRRYERIVGGVEFYEGKVGRLGRELERINRGGTPGGEEHEDDCMEEDFEGARGFGGGEEEDEVTEEDLRAEEEEIRELERKKKELEDRFGSAQVEKSRLESKAARFCVEQASTNAIASDLLRRYLESIKLPDVELLSITELFLAELQEAARFKHGTTLYRGAVTAYQVAVRSDRSKKQPLNVFPKMIWPEDRPGSPAETSSPEDSAASNIPAVAVKKPLKKDTGHRYSKEASKVDNPIKVRGFYEVPGSSSTIQPQNTPPLCL